MEGRAFARFAHGPDTPAVALDDVFYDGKPEAGAALLARAGFIHAIKPLEYSFERFGGDAGAIIAYPGLHFFRILEPRADEDGPFDTPVFDGVVHEIG